MSKLRKSKETDLLAVKRTWQVKSRALVESGKRAQESMFLIAPALARSAVVEHRVLSFD